jgi:hypothetical protein
MLLLLLLLLQSPPATFITAAHPSMPCAGEFMWMADAGGGTAAERHYAQRYRQLRAQLDRSIEERAILATEVIRTFNWLEEREEAIEARMVELQGSMGGGAAAGGGWDLPWDQLQTAGKVSLLGMQLKRCRRIHADARARLR